MLKFLILNNKKVPVPIPVFNLGRAVEWIEEYLVFKGHTLTKLELDGRKLEISDIVDGRWNNLALTSESRLVVRIESPLDISVQTVDVLRNLVQVMLKSLQPIAVECWNRKQRDVPREITAVAQDVDLIADLLDHLLVLLDKRIDQQAVVRVMGDVQGIKLTMRIAISNSDWKGCAKVLLNNLEPKLQKLSEELATIQKQTLEIQIENCYKKVSNL